RHRWNLPHRLLGSGLFGGREQTFTSVGELLEFGPFDLAFLFSADSGEHAHPRRRQLAGGADHGLHLLLAARGRLRPVAPVLPALPGAEHVDLGMGEPTGVRVVAEHVLSVHAFAAAQDETERHPGGGEDGAEYYEADDLRKHSA